MAEESNRFSRFWQEIKRRKTDRVIVLYAATAFIILQLADILAPALSLPEWITTFIVAALAIGFPVTAVFSWFFDITPKGIEKTKPLSDKKKHRAHENVSAWKSTTFVSILIIIALLAFNIVKGSVGTYKIKRMDKTIAVLPFTNMSDGNEHPSFGDAITDEIILQLQKIEKFTVRSFTSVLQYKEMDKSVPVIARELEANFIVEGSVQIFEDRFRIRVQLVNAIKDYHLWGDTYEGEWKDIFTVQPEVAKKIADNLKTVLTSDEIRRIEKHPTDNASAYSEYLSGKQIGDEARYFFLRGIKYTDSTSFENAIRSYDQAIRYDSSFALAYAKRAILYTWSYYIGSRDTDKIRKCREDIKMAMKLDPELPEVKIADGFYYYYCLNDYAEALKHFKEASDLEPENWEPFFYMALVHRRFGNWTVSQSLMNKVLKYNPNDALVLTNIGLSYDYLRKYDSALVFHNKAIKILPQWESPYVNKIETLLRKDGTTSDARYVMNSAIKETGKSFLKLNTIIDIYDRKYREALDQVEANLERIIPSDKTFLNSYTGKLIECGMINYYMNNVSASRKYFSSAVDALPEEIQKMPGNDENYIKLGIAYAGLKNREKAVEAGERALALVRDNVLEAAIIKEELAKIYVMLGDYTNALIIMDELLRTPSCFSLKMLELDPLFRPLIYLPEFQKLAVKYAGI